VPPPATAVERITRYVANYDGGPCVYLTPTAISDRKAAVEGYGSQPAPFSVFEKSFQKANGFEPDISLRQVTQAQCAMVGFLAQVRSQLDHSLKLQINSFTLHSGDTLSGSVEGQGDRHVTVLLVADDGFVYDLAGYLSRDGDRLNFSLKVQIAGGTQAKPTVVMAIASPRPLASLPGGRPVAAEELFPRLAGEAQRNGDPVGVALKYFRVLG
jgi:eukaryotic-like serine/threonine-protein kinase